MNHKELHGNPRRTRVLIGFGLALFVVLAAAAVAWGVPHEQRELRERTRRELERAGIDTAGLRLEFAGRDATLSVDPGDPDDLHKLRTLVAQVPGVRRVRVAATPQPRRTPAGTEQEQPAPVTHMPAAEPAPVNIPAGEDTEPVVAGPPGDTHGAGAARPPAVAAETAGEPDAAAPSAPGGDGSAPSPVPEAIEGGVAPPRPAPAAVPKGAGERPSPPSPSRPAIEVARVETDPRLEPDAARRGAEGPGPLFESPAPGPQPAPVPSRPPAGTTPASGRAAADPSNAAVTPATASARAAPRSGPGARRLRVAGFAPGGARIPDTATDLLDRVARELSRNRRLTLLLAGHSERLGNPYAEFMLSRQRAIAVARALAARGIHPWRLRPAGFGSAYAVGPGEADPTYNRRVELTYREVGSP